MRFMLIEKTEPGAAPALSEAQRLRFEQSLVLAGVLLAAERLAPCDGSDVAGFWLIEVKSREEAREWARRAGDGAHIDIRQVAQAGENQHAIPDPVQGR
jgi:hypothetical protein